MTTGVCFPNLHRPRIAADPPVAQCIVPAPNDLWWVDALVKIHRALWPDTSRARSLGSLTDTPRA